VDYIFVEIRLPHKTLLVGSVYKPPVTSVVYHLLGAEGYARRCVPIFCLAMGMFIYLVISM
jgi:hypothetical protein